jgi:hypothetical protein
MWKFAAAAVGALAFVVVGIALLYVPSIAVQAAGMLSVVFFGGFVGYGLLRHLRGRGRLAILPGGLEIDLPGVPPRVLPWDEIEAIGVMKMSGQEFTTVRLRTYRSFLSGIEPPEARHALRFFHSLRLVGLAAVGVGAAHLQDVSELGELLSGSKEVQSVADILRYYRTTFGAEFLLGWSMRDRSAAEFAELLELARTGSDI